MAESIGYIKEHRLSRFMILSGLLHVLLLFLFAQQNTFGVLGLLQPPKPEERQIAFEIVETPEDSRSDVPPEETNLLSDKQSIARDRNPEGLMDSDVPYSEGVYDMKSLESNASTSESSREGESSGSRMMVRSYSSSTLRSGKASEFSREILLGQDKPSSTSSKSTVYDQRKSSVNDLGGLSFNTYAWDFAPYLLELKSRIQKNIYPPPAFTHLGFGGRNIVRFRIYTDGRLEALQVLGYEGEQALVETSKKAIQLSAPFRVLPRTFPEDFLEVTGSFIYMGINRN